MAGRDALPAHPALNVSKRKSQTNHLNNRIFKRNIVNGN
jgi:hypothetical protein